MSKFELFTLQGRHGYFTECIKCKESKLQNFKTMEGLVKKFDNQENLVKGYLCRKCRIDPENHKALQKIYEASVRGKAVRRKYLASVKGKTTLKGYFKSGAKNPSKRITLDDLAAAHRKRGKVTKWEFVKHSGICCRDKVRAILAEYDMTIDELTAISGVEFANSRSRIGHDEKQVLDEIEKRIGRKIERQKPVAGYFADGYDKITNTIYERDEWSTHKYQRIEDEIREDKIWATIGCNFVRIQDGGG